MSQEVTLVHFRLLVLSDFGSADPFSVVDRDASETVDVMELRAFLGTLAVSNATNAQQLFDALVTWTISPDPVES